MEDFSRVNSTSPVVFKRKAAWDGIRVEHVRLSAGDLPKHCHAEHTVLISRSDPVISNVGMALLAELDSQGLSGRLYAESLANVLAVHLLRYYTNDGLTTCLLYTSPSPRD